jgi:hypothetical protein
MFKYITQRTDCNTATLALLPCLCSTRVLSGTNALKVYTPVFFFARIHGFAGKRGVRARPWADFGLVAGSGGFWDAHAVPASTEAQLLSNNHCTAHCKKKSTEVVLSCSKLDQLCEQGHFSGATQFPVPQLLSYSYSYSPKLNKVAKIDGFSFQTVWNPKKAALRAL